MKKKSKAIAFVFYLASFYVGGHRFYLGSKKIGATYVILFLGLLGLAATESEDAFTALAVIWMILIVFDFFWVLFSKKPYEIVGDSAGPGSQIDSAPAASNAPFKAPNNPADSALSPGKQQTWRAICRSVCCSPRRLKNRLT